MFSSPGLSLELSAELGGQYCVSCADSEIFLSVCPASDQGRSDKILPFQTPYPGKMKGPSSPEYRETGSWRDEVFSLFAH